MAKVTDATTAVGSSASWFKINEMGLPSSNPDYWATEVLNVRHTSNKAILLMSYVPFLTCLIHTGQLRSLHCHDPLRYRSG